MFGPPASPDSAKLLDAHETTSSKFELRAKIFVSIKIVKFNEILALVLDESSGPKVCPGIPDSYLEFELENVGSYSFEMFLSIALSVFCE